MYIHTVVLSSSIGCCISDVHTNVFKEFSSTDILHDHEDVRGRGDDFIEFDDVRVTKQLEQLDLSSDLLLHIQTREVGEGEGRER